MKIIGLDSSEFWEKYLPLCKPLTGLTDAETEKFSAALDSLTSKLEKALSSYNEGEYEIAYDWNTCWHHCGGVFGKKAFCPDFIQCIADVLATENHPWCFHLALEPECESLADGQLFFYNGNVYADASGELDYCIFESE